MRTDKGQTDQLPKACVNKCVFRADLKESRVGTRQISSGKSSRRVGAATPKALVPEGSPAGVEDREKTHFELRSGLQPHHKTNKFDEFHMLFSHKSHFCRPLVSVF